MKALLSTLFLGAVCSAGLMAGTVQVTLANVGSSPLTDSNNVYVGPYTLSVNGVYMPALCVDNKDWSNLNSTWTANITSLSMNSSALTNTYHPASGDEYAETAVLYSMITKPGADRVNLQHAAWDIMNYSITGQSSLQALISNNTMSKTDGAIQYIDDAMNSYASMNLTGYEIVTAAGINCARQQEFLVYDPATATPEPTTYALLGLGLVMIGGSRAFFNRRKMNQKQPEMVLVRR